MAAPVTGGFGNRFVAIVGIGSVGANGDALSSYLFRRGEVDAGRQHLAKRMGVEPAALIGHHGIRKADPTFMDFDPRRVEVWRKKNLAEAVNFRFKGPKGSIEERSFAGDEFIRVPEYEQFPVSFAAQMPAGWDWRKVAGFQRRRFKNMGEASRMGAFCSGDAVISLKRPWEAITAPGQVPRDRIGNFVGSGIGANDVHTEMKVNPWFGEKISTYTLAESIPDTPGAHVGMLWGLEGIYSQLVGACATAGLSLYHAVWSILSGLQLMAFAGGVDAALTYDAFVGFLASTALVDDAFLAKHGLTPEQASRAFNLIRGGFVMGAGGGVLIPCDLDLAMEKGWEILAIVAGMGNRGDGYQAGLPSPGAGIRKAFDEAFEMACERHKLTADEIAFYHAHGTSTDQNDSNEASHLEGFLEDNGRSADNPLPVTAQKEEDGHTLGGASGKAMVETTQILKDGIIPGLRNLDQVDPDIEKNRLLKFSRLPSRVEGRAGMGGTLGFGHHNASWIFLPGTPEELRRIREASEVATYEKRRKENEQAETDFLGPLESGEKKLWDILPEPSRK